MKNLDTVQIVMGIVRDLKKSGRHGHYTIGFYNIDNMIISGPHSSEAEAKKHALNNSIGFTI